MNTESLLLSVGVILLTARVFGWMFHVMGQPRVVGEMMAGIALGPSVLGHFFPLAMARVFPSSSLSALNALSQLGLLLFMFLVGLEVDLDRLLKQRAAVVLTSNFSIVTPFVLGILLARRLYPEYAGAHVAFPPFALFLGMAMSITAFPVLARILKERNLLRTPLGAMAISCAAIDDASAWLLLAILTATVRSSQSWSHFAATMLGLLAFVIIMLFPVRRAARLLETYFARHGADMGFFSTLVLIMLASSWTTERLGVHALFGAFMAGLIIPRQGRLVARTVERIESLPLVLLLPLFFALTGLRTRVDLLVGAGMWINCLAIIAVAVLGKMAGATLTARTTGIAWKDSLALGVLMNTRGLVELVVLNAGLELGILSPPLFTMMVLMALATTLMTTPALSLMKVVPARDGPPEELSTAGPQYSAVGMPLGD